MVDDSDPAKTTIRWIDPGNGSVLGTVAFSQGLAFGPSEVGGNCVVVTPGATGSVMVLDNDHILSTSPLDMSGRNAAVVGDRLYAYAGDGILTPIDPATGATAGPDLELPAGAISAQWQLTAVSGQLWVFDNIESPDLPIHASRVASPN